MAKAIGRVRQVVVPGKAATLIPGFDALTEGGLPRGRTTLLAGTIGSGKTMFALQFLLNGLRAQGEPGIFVGFEEQPEHLLANAPSEWKLTKRDPEKLFLFSARLSSSADHGGDFDLGGLLAMLRSKAAEMKATRIVFDGIDVLLDWLSSDAARRKEAHRLHEWLQETGLTGVLTAKFDGAHPTSADPYGFMQFMADCVVSLRHTLVGQTAFRTLRVLKYRGGGPSTNELPLVIGPNGIEVGYSGGVALEHAVYTDKVSSGIERLDTMLGGGYYRGSSVLVSGLPGTAKSSLAGSFVQAACRRGERALFISFDEAATQIERNLRSIGVRLGPHLKSGALLMASLRALAVNPEEHLIRIRSLMRQHRAQCVVIDPVSALPGAGENALAHQTVLRLLDLAKSSGVTLLSTTLLAGNSGLEEATTIGISTVADTWIHLSYSIQAGERNRALTIVKSRGMRHSAQVRELVLSEKGITLADVYTAGGQVLMGTLRWEKEAADQAQGVLAARARQRQQRELELDLTQTRAQLEVLKQKMTTIGDELQRVSQAEADEESQRVQGAAGVARLRGADARGRRSR